ncbi:unknown [Corallococcus sp. CAG:1435]|nr:unknown [Corallococcus sp. CAG:1435]
MSSRIDCKRVLASGETLSLLTSFCTSESFLTGKPLVSYNGYTSTHCTSDTVSPTDLILSAKSSKKSTRKRLPKGIIISRMSPRNTNSPSAEMPSTRRKPQRTSFFTTCAVS